jgi:4-hydroxy-tetrahydrodipicolinate synthase
MEAVMRFPGVTPAIITPFDGDGAVDLDALEHNVRGLLNDGVAGIVATGTMGEAHSLSAEERRQVVERVVASAEGQVPITAGVSGGDPTSVVGYASDAKAVGADALMLLPPLLYVGDDDEVVGFYRAVAERIDLPIMVYNNPQASGGHDLSPALLARIAREVPQVVAVKECSSDARRIAAIVELGGLEVLVGGDDWALEGFCAGATGWVSGAANVAPRECVALYEQCVAGDLAAARATYERLLPMCRLDMTPKLVQYFKEAMDAVGRKGGPCRPPRLPLTDAERVEVRFALDRLALEPAAA